MALLPLLVGAVFAGGAAPGPLDASAVVAEALGEAWSEELSLRLERRLLTLYERNGFPLAAVRLAALETRGDSVFADYALTPGAFVVVGGIAWRGNRLTRPSTLMRYARPLIGRAFSTASLAEVSSALEDAELARLVGYAIARSDDAGFVVVAEVEEPPYGDAAGALTYDDVVGGLVGNFRLEHRNLMGTARRLYALYNRVNVASQDVRLSYTEPWAFGTDFAASPSLDYAFRDSLYLSERVSLALAYPLRSWRLAVVSSYENAEDFTESTRVSRVVMGATARERALRPRYAPLRGHEVRLAVEGAARYLKLSAQGDLFLAAGLLSLRPRVFAGLLSGRTFAFDLFRVGGTSLPRGVPEESVVSDALWVGSLEVGLVSNPRPYLLLDGAFYRTPGGALTVLSRGFGISAGTRAASLSLHYAVPFGAGALDGLVGIELATGF